MTAHPSAADKPWNSATTLYIARALHSASRGRSLSVLDMGCGEGRLIRYFNDYGHRMHGFDLPDRAAALRANLGPLFPDDFDRRIRIADDERRIPFDDSMFDVVYANQVFEHIRFLDQMLAECVRVLKPGGTLITLFPTATYPVEGHALIPFAHWLPPGRGRRRYLTAMLAIGIGRRFPGMSRRQSAAEWDERLKNYTFYRFMNEIVSLFEHYFESTTVDTGGYIDAKLDLLANHPARARRWAARLVRPWRGPWLNALVTHGFMGVFTTTGPKPAAERQRMLAWKVQDEPDR
jgi:SAM-dependent methyltransferase